MNKIKLNLDKILIIVLALVILSQIIFLIVSNLPEKEETKNLTYNDDINTSIDENKTVDGILFSKFYAYYNDLEGTVISVNLTNNNEKNLRLNGLTFIVKLKDGTDKYLYSYKNNTIKSGESFSFVMKMDGNIVKKIASVDYIPYYELEESSN